MGRARSTFGWLSEGPFLLQLTEGEAADDAPREWHENSPLPTVCLIGLDAFSDTFAYLHSDARGVYRTYQMSLRDGLRKIWGQSGPEFVQRSTATFGDDGDTITGRWEQSRDASVWELDFDVAYARVG